MDEQNNNYQNNGEYNQQYQNPNYSSQYTSNNQNNGEYNQQYQNPNYSAQYAPNNQYNGEYNRQYQNPNYYSQFVPNNQPYYQPTEEITENKLPNKFKPLGAWAYFGYTILFSIPLIGLIFNLIFCFDNSNINRRNFARSMWCLVIIIVALLVLFFILFGTLPIALLDLKF